MKRHLRYALALFVVMCGNDAVADVLLVPGDAATIQAGINLANHGDTVLVADGMYVENINFMGKAITVTSVNGPASTTIDGSAAGPVVTFSSGETANAVLSGFTIRNGRTGGGGGVRIGGSSPVVRDNVITNNVSTSGGGGVFITGGAPLIENNVITLNQASNGNGIGLDFTSAIVRGNTITSNTRGPGSGGIGGGGISIGGAGNSQVVGNLIANNSTSTDGGGISLFAAGTPTIRENTIRNNRAASGGGISHANFSDSLIVQNLIVGNTATGEGGGVEWLVPSGRRGPLLVNNTIAFNMSPGGSGLFADGFDRNAELYNNIIVASPGQTAVVVGSFNDANAPKFFNNNLFSAGGAAYSGIGTNPTGSNGNISMDAMFVDSAAEDFRLLPASGLIDAGTNSAPSLPARDLDIHMRVFDGNADSLAIVDIGAFELIPEPSTIVLLAGGLIMSRVALRLRR